MTEEPFGTVRPDPRRRSFAQVPEDLIRDLAVCDRGVRLWALLDRRAKGREVAIGSRAKLAEELGCSVDSLDRAMRDLLDRGWIVRETAPGRLNRYVLCEEPLAHPGSRTGAVTHSGSRTGAAGVAAPVRPLPRAVPSKREREGEAPRPPAFPGRCAAHGDVAVPPACGACADARLALASEPTPSPAPVAALLASVPSFDPDGTNARGRAAARAAIARWSVS